MATAGRVIVPVLIQQILDRGFDVETGPVDTGLVGQLVALGAGAIAVTAFATGLMNWRLAVVTERTLSNLRRRSFAHIQDLSIRK